MSRNSAARSRSQWMLRNLLIEIATFTVAAAVALLAAQLALGLSLTVPYFAAISISTSSDLVGTVMEAPAAPNAAPAYIWWVAMTAGLVAGLRISWLVFWKVEPIASRYLHDRFGVRPPTYPLDNTRTY